MTYATARSVALLGTLLPLLGISVVTPPAPAARPAASSTLSTSATVATLPAAGTVGGDRLGSTGVVLAPGAPAIPAKLSARSWLVADSTTGAVLAARNPHGRFAPASTLKILTAVTLLPRLHPQQTIVVTNADETVDGTKIGFVPGLRVRVDTLFTAMLVASGNDAAKILARAAGGSALTLRLMAAEAHRLQALDTVPRTVHGLDARGQVSSAYDLALLGRAGMAQPTFRRYVAIRRARMPAPGGTSFEIGNHNRLLASYRGTVGIKNGHTDAAGSSLVAAARRGNRSVLVTLMRADRRMWREAAALLDWAFRAAGRATPVGTLVPPLLPTDPSGATSVPSVPPPSEAPEAQAENRALRPELALVGAAVLALVAALLLIRRRRP